MNIVQVAAIIVTYYDAKTYIPDDARWFATGDSPVDIDVGDRNACARFCKGRAFCFPC